MNLTLQIENFHVLDDGSPVSVQVGQRGIQAGRSAAMDWVLPDASRHISGHHFDITIQDGQWLLHDRSTNGTYLHGHRHRLDGPHVLTQGDRFQVGQYIIAAVFDMPQAHPMTPDSLPAHRVDTPVAEAQLDDPWALAPAPQPIDVASLAQSRRGPDFAQDFVPLPQHAGAAQVAPVPDTSPAPDVLHAFCAGAGLPPDMARDADPAELAHALGQTMRLMADHLMAALQDRATARHFTRTAERTMRGATDNNPLKFLPDGTEALAAMFLKPRAGFMTGAAGFDNALGDLRRHQTAVFAALQPALLGVLADLSPEQIQQATGSAGLMGNKKARAWDEYVARWDARSTSENGILDEFLRLFADAYRKAHGDGPDP